MASATADDNNNHGGPWCFLTPADIFIVCFVSVLMVICVGALALRLTN